MITYILAGDLRRVRIPKSEDQRPRFSDGLWRHTCCEAFVAHRGHAPYHEFNFSPSGEWAMYAFARYRERAPVTGARTPDELAPHITVCRIHDQKLELDAVIHLDGLSLAAERLALGIAAVIEGDDGTLSYWALHHPLDKPDFHHPDAFVLELDEVRH